MAPDHTSFLNFNFIPYFLSLFYPSKCFYNMKFSDYRVEYMENLTLVSSVRPSPLAPKSMTLNDPGFGAFFLTFPPSTTPPRKSRQRHKHSVALLWSMIISFLTCFWVLSRPSLQTFLLVCWFWALEFIGF